jgi:CRP-like cAMP-binding protein
MDDGQRRVIAAFLRQGEWFAGLPPPLQEQILARSFVRSFTKGQRLHREDTSGPGLIALLEGHVAMVRHVGDGDPALFHVAGPGFWLGHLGVLDDAVALTGIAQTPVRALILPRHEFDRIIEDEPRYYAPFAQAVFRNLRYLMRYFAETVQLSPEYRLRLRLADLADVRRADADVPGRSVVLDISQAELASIVGLSRQRLNGHLKVLEAAGWIELSLRRIRVLDSNGLRTSAPGDARSQEARDASPAPPATFARRASSSMP